MTGGWRVGKGFYRCCWLVCFSWVLIILSKMNTVYALEAHFRCTLNILAFGTVLMGAYCQPLSDVYPKGGARSWIIFLHGFSFPFLLRLLNNNGLPKNNHDISSKPSLSESSPLTFNSCLNLLKLSAIDTATSNPSFRSSSVTLIHCNLHELCDHVWSVTNTQKITEAWKLVGATEVR